MNYPEHEKLQNIYNYSQKVGEFLDWLQSQGYIIVKWNISYNSDRHLPYDQLTVAQLNIHDILARFFEIDQTKLENEKRDMLNQLQ